jgi:hypothetical protein
MVFAESDAQQEVNTECKKIAGDDAAKLDACLSKTRTYAELFERGGYAFERGADGKLWWTEVYDGKEGLSITAKGAYVYERDTSDRAVLKIVGKDPNPARYKGLPAELVFDIVSTERIVEHDPKHGKVVYKARRGKVPEDKIAAN